ncbi:MAG: fibronectin type III domain-containing protein [Eubacterium sp.]
MKRMLSLIISFAIVISSFSVGIIQANADVSDWTPIATKEDLYNIRKNLNGKYYLTDDIIFTDEDYIVTGDFYGGFDTPGSTFNGVIDGCGHIISNLRADNNFFYSNNGIIKNIEYDEYYADKSNFVTENNGTISNVKFVDSKLQYAVEENSTNGEIEYIHNDSSIMTLVETNYGTVDKCYANAKDIISYYSGWDYYSSPIVNLNRNSGVVSGCINASNISGKSYDDFVGGVVAGNYGKVTSCVNKGIISVEYASCGAIVGELNGNGYAENCINYGQISGYRLLFGIGDNAINCINFGTFKGLGTAYSTYQIGNNSYNSYYNNTLTGQDKTSTPVSPSQLSDPNTFKNFDFKDIWEIKDNKPHLQIENEREIGIAPYCFTKDLQFKINDEFTHKGLVMMYFTNLSSWEILEENAYTVEADTKALGKKEAVITSQSGSEYKYSIWVYDLINNQKISLDSNITTYGGKAIQPKVTVKTNAGKILILNRNYSVKYSNNNMPGVGTVTVSGIGDYKGSTKLSFIIKPNAVKGLAKSSSTSSSIKLQWTKQNGVNGYEIQKYNSADGKWSTVKTVTSNTNTATVSSLSSGKGYKFRVRAYIVVNKTKYYGAYSESKTFVTKPKSTSISSISAKPGGFYIKYGKISGVSGYQIQYSTSSKFSNAKTVSVGSSTTKKTIQGLNASKRYYVRVRTYKTVNGTKYYSDWSKSKSITTGKVSVAKVKITSFRNYTNGYSITKWKSVKGVSGYEVQLGDYWYDSYYNDAHYTWYSDLIKTVKGADKTSCKINYKGCNVVRVRAYKVIQGKKYYGAWSKSYVTV